jgi:hypothetical protein
VTCKRSEWAWITYLTMSVLPMPAGPCRRTPLILMGFWSNLRVRISVSEWSYESKPAKVSQGEAADSGVFEDLCSSPEVDGEVVVKLI